MARISSLSNVFELVHFEKDQPSGELTKFTDVLYEIRWITSGGTVVDSSNTAPTNTAVGLVPGQKHEIRFETMPGVSPLVKGAEAWVLVYLYRPTKPCDLDELLRFDASVLAPDPAPTVTSTAPGDEVHVELEETPRTPP